MAKDKKIFTEDLAAALRTPFESGNVGPIKTLEDVKKFFALPRTMAYDSKDPAEAERLNSERLAHLLGDNHASQIIHPPSDADNFHLYTSFLNFMVGA